MALDGELVEIAHELVRGGYWKRVHIGLDYFDASVNRSMGAQIRYPIKDLPEGTKSAT